ncbi:DsbA family protein [Halococcus saccharolyticus]|uniref:DSBA oxidoreductase n=1 Tax=Halococcus saccharolyticus DSM 5350 TaxID=1227455 RepID=M0MIG0_9EURY|nr:thioredoxin [Halococcus saccharolyticus]EMA45471.1 DSBA oxidoreductase [Halococcus saccharolyticus DSM 5350]
MNRRRALLGAAGLATTALAGCLGSGASGNSGSSGNASGQSGDALPAPVKGDAEASVTVAVFEDFACPHCRTYNVDVLPQIESEYIESGTIRYEHWDFPIVNQQSNDAANAARAVQDRADDAAFWNYAGLLFENQSSLGADLYGSLASEVGLEADPVRSAATNRSYESTVQGDKEQGRQRGVTSTPTVVVNGNVLSEYSFDAISSAIESAR